jgi:ferredoxin
MDELRNKARELLEAGTVQMVIGYEQGTGNKTRPVIIDNPTRTGALIFDSRCVQNLAVYITKAEVRKKGKPAIVASVPVLRSIIQLASENQVVDQTLFILGVTPDFKLIEFKTLKEVEIFLEQHKLEIAARDQEMIDRLDGMDTGQRWKFWMETLEPCFKCYACRAACPLCYCPRCAVESNQPQWVPVASHTLGNLEWHIMRAMHMAGRCTDCEACANACPIGIPLNLLTKRMMREMQLDFGQAGPSLTAGNMMSTFRPEDKDNFIK